jgi:hypothetical protein
MRKKYKRKGQARHAFVHIPIVTFAGPPCPACEKGVYWHTFGTKDAAVCAACIPPPPFDNSSPEPTPS